MSIIALKKTNKWLFCSVFLTIILSLPIFSVPLGRDQGIFAYVADGIVKGLSPYKYSFDIKPPFVYFIYALSFVFFGKSSHSIYLIDIVYRLVTLVAIYLTAKKMYGEREGLGASLLYGIFSSIVFNRIWRCAQTEVFMVLPLVLAVYFFIDDEKAFLCGIFSGIAFSVKYSALFIFIPLPLLWAFKDIKKSLLFVLGFSVSLIPFIIYFFHYDSLYALYISTIKFNVFHVARRFYIKPFLSAFLRYGHNVWREMYFLIILSSSFLFFRSNKYYKLLVIWLCSTFFSLAIQGKFWFYHWIIFLGPLCIMAGRQIVIFYERLGQKKWQKMVMGFFYVGMFLLSLKSNHICYRISQNISYFKGEISRKEFLLPFDKLSNNVSFSNAENMAKYIKENTDEHENIWIFGHESLVYFLADRRAPTRFQWDYPLTIDIPEAVLIKDEFRKTCLKEINENKPQIIFIVLKDTNPIERENSVIQWEKIAEFVNFLSENYTFREEKYNSLIYWRKK